MRFCSISSFRNNCKKVTVIIVILVLSKASRFGARFQNPKSRSHICPHLLHLHHYLRMSGPDLKAVRSENGNTQPPLMGNSSGEPVGMVNKIAIDQGGIFVNVQHINWFVQRERAGSAIGFHIFRFQKSLEVRHLAPWN